MFKKSIQMVRDRVVSSKNAIDHDIDNPPSGVPTLIVVEDQQSAEDLVRQLIVETNYDDDPDPSVMAAMDLENDDDF